MKKILVLHTGGTISMQADQNGAVESSPINPMTQVTSPLENIEVVSVDFLNLPSPHIQIDHMMMIYKKIREEASHFDGFVITHGTDTLEETAYFLDTMSIPQKPIVMTGAMRSSNELGSDGIYNYRTALRVAADEKSADKGVLVVMNDEIHAAKYVTKTHTTNVSTFQTPTHGPLGLVTKREILFFKAADKRVRFDLQAINGVVPIIKSYADMDTILLDALVEAPISGLVIEALGAGNLPPASISAIKKLINKQLPIVLVSRCFNGIAEPVYAYDGGGIQLEELGVLFVKELNPQKARIKLLIAVNAGLNGQDLADYIQG
ncbi:asparaginase [Streptococcus parasuis]|uniref:asparaginase n=1 Tax=Streptococcus TaxID=1301 RepID=UPI001C2CB75D|nr:asparaginase [Streptococcus parasuis]MDG3146978.1 asparaginase [Streptococcus suis]MBV1944653.1 asparaginase [Streptococcus parasuis]MDG3181756.1 asparaginase [Streptococcus suis]MDG3214311.1 asparaginase [Streptococcus suis]QXF05703.1 asparaginase [Streptococcus parasuis]